MADTKSEGEGPKANVDQSKPLNVTELLANIAKFIEHQDSINTEQQAINDENTKRLDEMADSISQVAAVLANLNVDVQAEQNPSEMKAATETTATASGEEVLPRKDINPSATQRAARRGVPPGFAPISEFTLKEKPGSQSHADMHCRAHIPDHTPAKGDHIKTASDQSQTTGDHGIIEDQIVAELDAYPNEDEDPDSYVQQPSSFDGLWENAQYPTAGTHNAWEYAHDTDHGMPTSRQPPVPDARFAKLLDKFHGKVGQWEDWYHKFRHTSRMCKWSDGDKLFIMTSALVGPALTAHRNLPLSVTSDYKSLVKAFKQRFGKVNTATKAALRTELACIKQREGEDLENFADRVYALTMDAHPRSTSAQQLHIYAVEAFLRGCSDRNAAWLTCNIKDPATIGEAVNQMKLAQSSSKRMGVKYVVRSVATQEEDCYDRSSPEHRTRHGHDETSRRRRSRRARQYDSSSSEDGWHPRKSKEGGEGVSE